jgi:stringent starvation protein B
MPDLSTKPYLIRAIYEWCNDSGFTPYIAVAAGEGVKVPPEHVRNGEIVLNVSALATNRLAIGNEAIEFQARFGGVAREVHIPISRVIAIYARESGQGMAFEPARSIPIGGPDTVLPELSSATAAPAAVMASAPARPGSLELAPSGPPGQAPDQRPGNGPSAGAPGEGGPPTRPPGTPNPGERPRLKRVK